MGIAGTKVAQSASDIVILDDKFSSIVRAIMWGRNVYDNIRKFLQFQLTVNVVAILIVFIGACGGFHPPLNAVMMLWINLVMDTLGALALATEIPTMKLLDRRPYKRQASLISRPMMRHIIIQAIFQLAILLVLLFAGPAYFNIPAGEWCGQYKVDSKSTMWDPYTGKKDPAGTVTCQDFRRLCESEDAICLKDESFAIYPNFDTENNGSKFKFDDLDGFASSCLTCVRTQYTHGTIMFNFFVFAQIFNEFNAKSLSDEWNVYGKFFKNHIYIMVFSIQIGMQLFLVYLGGEFVKTSPLTLDQWIATVVLGSFSLPLGIMMRWVPVEEDPESFFESADAGRAEPVSINVKESPPPTGENTPNGIFAKNARTYPELELVSASGKL